MFSFEAGYTCTDSSISGMGVLSPIGLIQQSGNAWVNSNQIGTHIVQFGVLLDFFAGYTPP